MEQTLRSECNYTGSIPYWDWTKTAEEGFANSEMFDGSATSLSGNGALVNYTDSDVIITNNGTSAEVGKSNTNFVCQAATTQKADISFQCCPMALAAGV